MVTKREAPKSASSGRKTRSSGSGARPSSARSSSSFSGATRTNSTRLANTRSNSTRVGNSTNKSTRTSRAPRGSAEQKAKRGINSSSINSAKIKSTVNTGQSAKTGNVEAKKASQTKEGGFAINALKGGLEFIQSKAKSTANPNVTKKRIGDVYVSDEALNSGEEAPALSAGASKAIKIILIVSASIVAAVCIALAILSGTKLFTVENIVVRGASHLTDIEMVELCSIPEGTTLINVDTESIRARLLLDTWIKDASVSRVFPDSLLISVNEREINAVAEIPSQNGRVTRLWALAADGLWIMPIPDKDSEAGALINPQIYEDVEKVLHIVDIPYGATPEIGTYCDDEYVNNALNIVSNLSTSLSEKIVTVKATEAASTTLILDNGIEIAFGAATDIRDKERVCLELLERYSGQIAYINCSVVDDVTWRSIS